MSLTSLQTLIQHTLDERKAEQIVSINLIGKASFADCMIIASGTSSRHVASLAENLVYALKQAGMESVPVEGLETSEWVLVDAGNVIVHLFRPEARQHYNLEKMWSVSMPETPMPLRDTGSQPEAAR